MHSGKSYHIGEFIIWTRRNIFWLILVGVIPVTLFEVFQIHWIAIPWTVVALLGTATAFIVGFKNTQAYNRTWEARQIWGAIVNSSRSWGAMSKNMVTDDAKSKELIYRHFAWLTALRYQMRDTRIWETASKSYNKEYSKYYHVPERETSLESELIKYIDRQELDELMKNKNRATQLLAKQSKLLRELLDSEQLDTFRYLEMQKVLNEFFEHQGKVSGSRIFLTRVSSQRSILFLSGCFVFCCRLECFLNLQN